MSSLLWTWCDWALWLMGSKWTYSDHITKSVRRQKCLLGLIYCHTQPNSYNTITLVWSGQHLSIQGWAWPVFFRPISYGWDWAQQVNRLVLDNLLWGLSCPFCNPCFRLPPWNDGPTIQNTWSIQQQWHGFSALPLPFCLFVYNPWKFDNWKGDPPHLFFECSKFL